MLLSATTTVFGIFLSTLSSLSFSNRPYIILPTDNSVDKKYFSLACTRSDNWRMNHFSFWVFLQLPNDLICISFVCCSFLLLSPSAFLLLERSLLHACDGIIFASANTIIGIIFTLRNKLVSTIYTFFFS